MAYNRVNWQNLPSTTTPINATNLNKMDTGIYDAHTKIDNTGLGGTVKTISGSIDAITESCFAYLNNPTASGGSIDDGYLLNIYKDSLHGVQYYISYLGGYLKQRVRNGSSWSFFTEVSLLTGVKGNAESSYRTGNVNITPANIGALSLSGGTLTDTLYVPNILPTVSSSALGSSGALWNKLWTNEVELPSVRLYTSGNASILGVAEQLTVRYKGNINQFMPVSASAFNVNSSRRYKENIKDMTEEEANKILDINVVKFDYKVKQNGTNVAGVIAEPTYEVLPNVVTLAKIDGKEVPDSVDYSKFVPYLIKKIQMQEEEIAELKKKL